MKELLSALGSFEVVENDEYPKSHQNSLTWKPEFNVPYPISKDYVFSEKPWTRPPQLPISFIGVNVVDVEKSTILESQTVKIRAGKIESISKTRVYDLQSEGYTTVDASGLYMIPGLIDCHVHVSGLSAGWGSSTTRGDYETAFMLRGMLYNGFTTVRDVAGAYRSHREATEEWLIPGPRMFVGGPLLSQTGGHGDHSDRDADPHGEALGYGGLGKGAILVDGVDACMKAARSLMRGGADHIKICSSGGVLSPTDKLDSLQFTVPEIRAICDVVKAMGGTLVTSHCFTVEGARNAIEAGVGGIEHGSLLDEDTLRLMAKKGIHLTPTLMVQELIVNGPLTKLTPKFNLEKAQHVAEATFKMLKTAHDVGVNIAFGSDTPGAAQLGEFGMRKRVLPSPAILKHATCNAAKVVGMEGKIGCIKEGAMADLLLLKSNPLEDVAILGNPDVYLKGIIKDGRCVRSTVGGLHVEVALV